METSPSSAEPSAGRVVDERDSDGRDGLSRLASMRLVATALNDCADPNEALKIVLSQAATVVGEAGAVIALASGDDHVELAAAHGIDEMLIARYSALRVSDAVPLTDAIRSGEPVWLSGKDERDALYPHLTTVQNRTEASATLPLTIEGSVVGALGVGCFTTHHFDATDQLFLLGLADITAAYLARIGAVSSGPRSGAMTASFGALAQRVLAKAPVGFALIDRDDKFVFVNDTLATIDGVSVAEHAGRPVVDVFAELIDQAAIGQIVHGEEAHVSHEVRGAIPAGGGRARDWIVDYFPVRDDNGMLLAIGATVVDITERNLLESQLRSTLEQQADDRFRLAMDSMLDLVTIETALRDDAGTIVDFRIEYMNGIEIDVAARRRSSLVGRTLLEMYPAVRDSDLFDTYVRVVESGEPEVIAELPYEDEIEGRTVNGFYAVQVVKFGDGLLIVARDTTAQRASQAALAHAAERIQVEHATVELLQQAILPTLPRIEGVHLDGLYLPAGSTGEVGGDWYDAFTLPDGRLGLAIGDVAGHGVEAASLMALLRNALRAYALLADDPSTAVGWLNDLLEREEVFQFATGIYATFDPDTRVLQWSRAGHPNVLVFRSGGSRYLDDDGGPPLGVIAGHRYNDRTMTLQPGDHVLLFTDGLIERRDEDIDTGFDRLATVAGALDPADPSPCAAIAGAVLGDRPRSDDVCLLLLRS